MKLERDIEVRDASAMRVAAWNGGELPRLPAAMAFQGLPRVNVQLHAAFRRVVDTSLDPYELLVLAGIARSLAPSRILEIGTYDGNTALNLAVNTPVSTAITTVDLPQDWDGELTIPIASDEINTLDMNQERVEIGGQFKHSTYAPRIRQVFGDSAALDWNTLGGPFDLIFIDGCHARAYVRSDTDRALAVLAPGGTVIWHDYGFIDDVSEVVDSYRDRMRLFAVQGTRFAAGFPKP
jgi:predicted O-methyltransferase YrrM